VPIQSQIRDPSYGVVTISMEQASRKASYGKRTAFTAHCDVRARAVLLRAGQGHFHLRDRAPPSGVLQFSYPGWGNICLLSFGCCVVALLRCAASDTLDASNQQLTFCWLGVLSEISP
jgi:hypothetical protein